MIIPILVVDLSNFDDFILNYNNLWIELKTVFLYEISIVLSFKFSYIIFYIIYVLRISKERGLWKAISCNGLRYSDVFGTPKIGRIHVTARKYRNRTNIICLIVNKTTLNTGDIVWKRSKRAVTCCLY